MLAFVWQNAMSCLRDGGFAAQRNVDCTSSAKRDGYTLFGTGAFNFMREFGDVQLLKTCGFVYRRSKTCVDPHRKLRLQGVSADREAQSANSFQCAGYACRTT